MEDQCGVCGGDNSTCLDCAGAKYGESYEDECGKCDADYMNDCEEDCKGVWGGASTAIAATPHSSFHARSDASLPLHEKKTNCVLCRTELYRTCRQESLDPPTPPRCCQLYYHRAPPLHWCGKRSLSCCR